MANGQGESSKQGKKRSKKFNLAAISISQQHGSESIRISERGSNPSPDQNCSMQRIPSHLPSTSNDVPDHHPNEEEEIAKKRKRGKTKLRNVSVKANTRVEVEFNARGQPIGINSEKLSSYLGSLSRELVPINIDDWRKVDEKKKNDLWTCVKTRFKVDDTFKKLILRLMGTRWRESKSRLIASLRDASKLPNKEALYASLKPDNISSLQDWNDFIEKKLSDEFEEKSKMFKKMRAKNQTPHTMSRKGYARLEEEMKKDNPDKIVRREDVWCKAHTKKNGDVPTTFVADCVSKIKEFNSSQTSPGSSIPITEDALSHALGPERNGRVRGMGFGISPSQVGVHMNSSKKVQVFEKEMSEMKKEIAHLKDLLMETIASKGNGNGNTPSPRSQNGSSHVVGSTNLNARNERVNGDVGRKCKLMNWQKTAVAEAEIASMDPNDVAHTVPLGNDVWKVWVIVPLDPKAPLWRPNSFMSVIEDAVGSTVAWHKDFITLD